MISRLLALASVAALAGCASYNDEQLETRVITKGIHSGTEYGVRTRTLQGVGGEYTQTSVTLNSLTSVCIPDSPGDCERAARILADVCTVNDR